MDTIALILNKARLTKRHSISEFLIKDLAWHKEEVLKTQGRVDFDLNASPYRLDAKRVRMMLTCPYCGRDY